MIAAPANTPPRISRLLTTKICAPSSRLTSSGEKYQDSPFANAEKYSRSRTSIGLTFGSVEKSVRPSAATT